MLGNHKNKSIYIVRTLFALLMAVCLLTAGFGFHDNALAVGFDRVADPATDEQWRSYYENSLIDYSNAGRIWADKSVRDSSASYSAEQQVYENGEFINKPVTINVNRSSTENFLVSLSAISSYKSIFGQGAVPLDVVFLLDISSSMRTSNSTGSITAMVEATNQSMDTIFGLNQDNRVGVVFFDGVAKEALPIGQYTPNPGPGGFTEYMTVSQDEDFINLDALGNVSPIPTESGTYTQGGLSQALYDFMTVSNISGRIPIMILMSDGSPTISTPSYLFDSNVNEPQPSVDGNTVTPGMKQGQGTTGITFITQLEAAYTKSMVSERYGTPMLFYTLGYGFENLSGNTLVLAETVLDPTKSTPDLDTYWNKFLALDNSGTQYIKVKNVSTEYDLYRGSDSLIKDSIQYVDQYFAAEDKEQLDEVFKEIMDEIEIQSRVYPTEISGENADMSGYLNFQDIIGEYMEVKKINGLLYEGVLYNGSYFAYAIESAYNDYLNGSGDNSTGSIEGSGEEANIPPNIDPAVKNHVYEFIKSSSVRLKIDIIQATELVLNAINNRQIYYVNDTDYANFVLWYGNDNDDYIGPANLGDTAANAPAGATALNRSYVFFREDNSVGKVGPDIMYIGARLKTNLATGRQTVIFTVPASMVPVVEYDIALDSDDPSAAAQATVNRINAYPVSVFYEVGLRAGLNEDTAVNIVADSYQYKNSDGSLTFYSNDWTKEAAHTAVSYTPATGNEFYYFVSDTLVYRDIGGGQYEPLLTPPDMGTQYYYNSQSYTLGTDTAVTQVFLPIPITLNGSFAEVLDVFQAITGYKIEKGTAKINTESFNFALKKSSNPTGTFEWVRVLEPGESRATVYSVIAELGNNGLLRLMPVIPTPTPAPTPTAAPFESVPPVPAPPVPQTGDGANLGGWLALALAGILAMLLAFIVKHGLRKKRSGLH